METKEARAYIQHIHVSPIQVKPVLDLIRGKKADVAMGILKNTPKSSCAYLVKLLNEAMANAEHNFGMDVDKLYVSEVFVCPGKPMKRLNYRGKGGADRIIKRTSHITLAVREKE